MSETIPSSAPASAPAEDKGPGLIERLRRLIKPETPEQETVREVIEELIEERIEDHPGSDAPVIDPNERLLLANVLKLRDMTAADIMIPRAHIVAVDADTPFDEVLKLLVADGHSRYPVFRGRLDDVIGMIHMKDLARVVAEHGSAVAYEGEEDTAALPKLADLLRKVMFVSPAVRVLDLLLEMRLKRTHMALVVDEFGGIDGLLTIEDVVEQIVGEIEDEHDSDQELELSQAADGAVNADARVSLEDFEAKFGQVFLQEERAQTDTLGGLVIRLAGRVPVRNELVKHDSGVEFEVIEGDPRRVRRVRIRNLPANPADTDADG
ncbi:MAG: HlyC/CorC family transporter [Rhodospirillaceae bacterium]|nr:HlyC/CorC family transporter [Rhodospirillaceae bacterium]